MLLAMPRSVEARFSPSSIPRRDLRIRGGSISDIDAPSQDPDLGIDDPSRKICIVTTACLPWMTGTAVNPILRAAHLTKHREKEAVMLLVPWVDLDDQKQLYPKGVTFDNEDAQRAYLLRWLSQSANMPRAAEKLRIGFYPGRYHKLLGCIFSMGSMMRHIPEEHNDICILEEPEHLNWYRYPEKGWLEKFHYVVGIVHTNYLVYIQDVLGPLALPAVMSFNQWMCRCYCHRVIKLSAVLQISSPGKETVCNVHGVRSAFLDVGARMPLKKNPTPRGAYYVGKQVWSKGYDLLIDLMKHYRRRMHGECFPIDLYGHGPDAEDISKAFTKAHLPMKMCGYADHADLTEYQVFINPSISEVLCTTISEALAMGKWVVCPIHPSNEFFADFETCLQYDNAEEFSAVVHYALHHAPPHLLPSKLQSLTWEAATDRLAEATLIKREEVSDTSQSKKQSSLQSRRHAANDKARIRQNKLLSDIHRFLGEGESGDFIRWVCAGSVVAGQVAYEKDKERAG
uniref:digalactosyldiacylglycerol synthase n=1 Tax=Octactis speculum TaxID=3111310 RepID=A0A7S2F4G6_9STRA